MMSSITSIPCGPPKPRNAVCEVLLVFAIRPCTQHVGDPVGVVDVAQRARRAPARRGRGSSRRRRSASPRAPVNSPSSSKPTRHVAWKPCRLPVIVMSCWRVSRSRTGRPVSVAPSAATAASPCGCISLPPNPPPIRRHCTVTRVAGHAEHVRDDLLGLGRVLGAGLHEDLAALVDHRQRAVRLEVEVLLPGDRRSRPRRRAPRRASPAADVAARQRRLRALEALGRDRLVDGQERRQRLVVDLDAARPAPRGLEASRRAPSRPRGRST